MAAWFTPEELEELAKADAQIERRFTCTPEELRDARLRDIRVRLGQYEQELQQAQYENDAKWSGRILCRIKYWRNQLRMTLAGETEDDKKSKEQVRRYHSKYQAGYYAANKAKYLADQQVIRETRLRRKLSQRQAAFMMGISPDLLCKWEKGVLRANWPLVERVFGNIGPKT